MKVKDVSGVTYELFDRGNGKVRLENQRFKDISHDYKKTFIEGAIQEGLLKLADTNPMQLKMQTAS